MSDYKAIDFFCSGGGMSFGMQQAGINVIAGIDFDKTCKETYETNIRGAKFIHADVFDLKERELEKKLALKKNDDNLVLIGCSPCQYWSIIYTKKKGERAERGKNLLKEFHRFVRYFNPGYVVVENVPGVLRRKNESGLDDFITWLEKDNKYKVHFKVHEVSEYGVPQHRKRFTLIANRVTEKNLEPLKINEKKITVRDVLGEKNGFPKIEAGHKDNTSFMHTAAGLKEINLKRLALTERDGGTRLAYANSKLAPECHRNKKDGFKDTYGRMYWDKPAPTITTKFFSISNGRFAHPEEDRAISLREGATLQSFPKNYIFKTTSVANTARMIGNAVPPKYAEAIGRAIVNSKDNE